MLECWNLPNDGIALSWCAKNSLAEQLLASAGLTCLPLFQSLPSSVPLEMCNNKYLLNENNKQRWFYQGKRWKPFLTDLMYTCSFWNWAGPCGASGMEAFIRNRLHTASVTFPEVQRAGSNSCLSGKGGVAETREEQSRNNTAALGQGPGSMSRGT